MAVALDPLAVPPELAGPQPVNAYIVHALAQNRAVQAARTRTVAIKNRIPQATALDDPTVQNIVWPLPNNGPQYSLMGYMPYELMISQEFPWLGTLRLRGEVAEQELKAALHELAATQLEVVSRVKRAYYTLYFNQRAEDILAESRTLAERVVEIANVKSETGTTTYQDVLRAQNLVTDVDGELVTVRQELASARATLARQLHVSPEAQLGALPELPVEQVPEQVERLYHLAAVARPELQAQLASIAKDHREVELAKKRYYPNITMGLAYGVMSRDNALSPTADGRDNIGLVVGFNLPIYRKKLVAGVCEAEARTIADAQRYEDLRDETYQEVKELFVEAKARQELLDLFRDIYLPRSEQALELATTDYQAATQDFLTLVTSWRELLALRLQIARLESDLGKALASLERVVGAQLNDEPDNTVQPQLTPPPPPGIESPFRLQSRAIDTENSGAAQ
jgi:outer membrane protein TolC